MLDHFEPFAHAHYNAKFLAQFPAQGRGVGFSRFTLPAGEFP